MEKKKAIYSLTRAQKNVSTQMFFFFPDVAGS